MRKTILHVSLVSLIAAGIIGCETKAQSGALIGGAGGAAAGGIIGHQSGHGTEGALIGGAVGAIGGALVGNEMDKADEREARRQREYERDRYQSSYDRGDERVTKYDVIRWTSQGTTDEIIIDRIERSRSVFYLTSADERDLRDEGVSRSVIRAMRDTERRASGRD